jgi:hypothetical protein
VDGGVPEQRQHAIALEARDGAAVTLGDDGGRQLAIPDEQPVVQLGVESTGQRGRADEVAEHHRDPTHLSGGLALGRQQGAGVEVSRVVGQHLLGQFVRVLEITAVDRFDRAHEENVLGGRALGHEIALVHPMVTDTKMSSEPPVSSVATTWPS